MRLVFALGYVYALLSAAFNVAYFDQLRGPQHCVTTCSIQLASAETAPPPPPEEEPELDPPPPQQINVQSTSKPEQKFIQIGYPAYDQEDLNPFSQKNMMQLMHGYPGALIRQPARPNTKFAAFEEAQRAYYKKWCTSKTWETDPPSAAAAVDWAMTVLPYID